ncbi:YdaU family protein [Shinella pollutisoli]|uniref:YdaU family protein n=1 Tax=Shinella pollutisoli TaxID=2250594 RepID=A0ABV7DJ05_9HYPH|nr:YdaU family protein [Shinella pollutisoli]
MSRRTMPYHRRYQGDALQGYRGLTLEQRGAYTTLLDLIYDHGGPIDFNERWIAGHLDVTVNRAKKLVAQLIELRKIYLTPRGQISNHRCEVEIENALKISKKRAESGGKRKGNGTEISEKPRKINAAAKHLLSNCSVIPEPEPYKDRNTDRSRHGETGFSHHALDAVPYRPPPLSRNIGASPAGAYFVGGGGHDQSDGNHLVAALERTRRDGRGALHALIADRKRRH